MPTVVEASQGDVFSVRPARALSAARHNARAFMPSRSPLWTCIKAEKSCDPKMRVKIRISAAAKK